MTITYVAVTLTHATTNVLPKVENKTVLCPYKTHTDYHEQGRTEAWTMGDIRS